MPDQRAMHLRQVLVNQVKRSDALLRNSSDTKRPPSQVETYTGVV